MARLENTRADNGRAAAPMPPLVTDGPADLPPNEPATESIDKVRDILFGGQMRAIESRLQGLEERLMHELSTMRGDFTKQLTEIDTNAKRDIEALAERLAAERTKRTEELKSLSAEMKELLRSLEKRHTKLEELTGLADAEIRDHILQQSRATAAEIERLSRRISADLNREVTSLRTEKADVSALVNVFTDMAARLGGDTRQSTKGSSRG